MSDPLHFFMQPPRNWGGEVVEVQQLKKLIRQLQSELSGLRHENEMLREGIENVRKVWEPTEYGWHKLNDELFSRLAVTKPKG